MGRGSFKRLHTDDEYERGCFLASHLVLREMQESMAPAI